MHVSVVTVHVRVVTVRGLADTVHVWVLFVTVHVWVFTVHVLVVTVHVWVVTVRGWVVTDATLALLLRAVVGRTIQLHGLLRRAPTSSPEAVFNNLRASGGEPRHHRQKRCLNNLHASGFLAAIASLSPRKFTQLVGQQAVEALLIAT